jgi:hypothetical protein
MNRSPTLLLLLAVAACGDNLSATHDAGVRRDAADDGTHASLVRAVAVSGDFTATGILSTLDIDTLAMVRNAVTGVAGVDPVVRLIDNDLLIVNRAGGDNVTILDATSLILKEQLATGVSSNPQDVAVKGNKLYVPALDTAGVVVLTRGSATRTTIDLSTALGDPDGKPDCVSAYLVGSDLYVACDLLDPSFAPRGPGKVAVIDTTTDTVRTTVTLPYANPQGFFIQTPQSSVFNGDLLIALMPNYLDLPQGCLARVTTGTTPTAACAMTNAETNGLQTHMGVQPSPNDDLLWMAVATDFSTGTLRAFDLKTGTLWSQPTSAASELISDLAVCPDGSIVASDTTFNAGGLRVYRDGSERTTDPLSIGLPPGFGNNLVCYALPAPP